MQTHENVLYRTRVGVKCVVQMGLIFHSGFAYNLDFSCSVMPLFGNVFSIVSTTELKFQ